MGAGALSSVWPMATTTRTKLTVEEFLVMSEADPRPMELIDGEVVILSHPAMPHARAQALLIGALVAWERRVPGVARVGGPTGVGLGPHDFYGPDLVVCRSQPRLNDRGRLVELPLVCVEIRSPSTWKNDVGRKKAVYEAQGVPELWLVDDVARVLLVFRRSLPSVDYYDTALELDITERLTSPLLPGFGLPLAELFEP